MTAATSNEAHASQPGGPRDEWLLEVLQRLSAPAHVVRPSGSQIDLAAAVVAVQP